MCKEFGCDSDVLARGLCGKHYARMKRSSRTQKCSIDDCDNIVENYKTGLCNKHYCRLLKTGSTESHVDELGSKASPTTKDLSWIAGFLEGEGSFRKGSTSHIVSACQCYVEPLEVLQKFLGGRISFRETKSENHNDRYDWYVTGARARGVMMTLYPMLSPRRRDQISNSLEGFDV